MAISYVTQWQNPSSGTTLSVSPTAVGDILVLLMANGGGLAGSSPTPSGGGVTTWNHAVDGTVESYSSSSIWWGVITAAGAATITLSTSQQMIECMQLHSSVSGTWSVESSAGTGVASSGGSSGNFPSLNPTGSDYIYVGSMGSDGATIGGSATGYTYDFTNSSQQRFVWGINQASPNSPPWTRSTANYDYSLCAAILTVAGPTCTVTFNANGGSGTMANETAAIPFTLTLNAFTRTGYTFAHWNTAADGSGTSYADGATYSTAANVTLYAIWTALSFPPRPTVISQAVNRASRY